MTDLLETPKTQEPKPRSIKFDDPNLMAYVRMDIELTGTAPLIVHAFSEKAKRIIEEKQTGKATAKAKKPPKVPEQEFLNAMHVIGERPKEVEDLANTTFGFPVVAFKAAVVRVAKLHDTPMTDARAMFSIGKRVGDGEELTEILSPELPIMRRDHVRLNGSTADLRYRPEFRDWKVQLEVWFHKRKITGEQLVAWFNDAGICNGVGEMRPGGKSSSGVYGTWMVTKATVFDVTEED